MRAEVMDGRAVSVKGDFSLVTGRALVGQKKGMPYQAMSAESAGRNWT